MVNLNPLIKADGYYALAQLVQIDSLREDSFAYLRAWAKKYLLFRKIELARRQQAPAPHLSCLRHRRSGLQHHAADSRFSFCRERLRQ